MKRLSIISVAIILGFVCAGCTTQALQNAYDKQETYIESIVTSLVASDENATVEYLDGVVKVTFSTSTATESDPALEDGGSVTFYYGAYTITSSSLTSSNLFATNSEELAEQSGWTGVDESMFTPETVVVGNGELVKGLEIGLPGVRKGDECFILFSGKYGWGKHPRGTVSANSALAYHILVTDVSNE